MTSSLHVLALFIEQLRKEKIDLQFIEDVIFDDLKDFDKGQIKVIFAAIRKRFLGNANPHHINEEWILKGDLQGACKIRVMSPFHIRIVYRVREEHDVTVVQIYAIGPRKDSNVYKVASNRKDW